MSRRLWLDRLENALLLFLVAFSIWATAGLWRSLPDVYFVPQRGVFLPEVRGPGLLDVPPVIVYRGRGQPSCYFPDTPFFTSLWSEAQADLVHALPARAGRAVLPPAYLAFPEPAGLPYLAGQQGEVVLPVGTGGEGLLLTPAQTYTFPARPLPPPMRPGVPAVPVTLRPGAVVPADGENLPLLRLKALEAREAVARSFNDPLVVREVPAGRALLSLSDGTALLQIYADGGVRYSHPRKTVQQESQEAAVLAASAFSSEHPLFGGGLVTGVRLLGPYAEVATVPLVRGLPLLGDRVVYRVAGDTVLMAEGRALTTRALGTVTLPSGSTLLLHLPAGTAESLAYSYPAYLAESTSAEPVLVFVLVNGGHYAVTGTGTVLHLSGAVP